MNDAHNVGNYTFAAGLFLLGLSPIQVTLGILGGALIIFGGCCLSGFMGHDTGAPYPVVSRLSWGIWGAGSLRWCVDRGDRLVWRPNVLGLDRAQGAARAVHPQHGVAHPDEFLGLDLLGWIAFLLLWGIQLYIVRQGMEAVRHFQGAAGPSIWVVMLVLADGCCGRRTWTSTGPEAAGTRCSRPASSGTRLSPRSGSPSACWPPSCSTSPTSPASHPAAPTW